MKEEVDFSKFAKLDIRAGEVINAEVNNAADDDCYKVKADFGEDIGVLKSSAKITDRYEPEDLIDKTIIGIINFPDKQIADMMSEFLLLGAVEDKGVSVLTVDKDVEKGTKIG